MPRVTRSGALAALLLSGCVSASAPPTMLGRYTGADERVLLGRVALAITEAGYDLESVDVAARRIEVRSHWRRRDAHARFRLTVEPGAWVSVHLVDHRGEPAERVHRPLAEEYARLMITVREELEPRAEDRTRDPQPLRASSAPAEHVNPRYGRAPSWRLIAPGLLVFAAGWVGSIAFGQEMAEGREGCRRTYGDLHAIPLAGAAIAVVDAWSCNAVPVVAFLVDGLITAAQLAGAILVTLGLSLGETIVEHEGPLELELAPFATPSSAGIAVSGRF